jgi:hypothetical protein
MMRAAMSGAPPGGMVTTILTARAGYCARALVAESRTARARIRIMEII